MSFIFQLKPTCQLKIFQPETCTKSPLQTTTYKTQTDLGAPPEQWKRHDPTSLPSGFVVFLRQSFWILSYEILWNPMICFEVQKLWFELLQVLQTMISTVRNVFKKSRNARRFMPTCVGIFGFVPNCSCRRNLHSRLWLRGFALFSCVLQISKIHPGGCLEFRPLSPWASDLTSNWILLHAGPFLGLRLPNGSFVTLTCIQQLQSSDDDACVRIIRKSHLRF